MIPFSTHSLALDCEEKSPMIAFQKDIYLCGCNGKSEEICIKVSAPQLWKRFLIVQLLIAFLATMNQNSISW
jgi:ubiquitin-protein ligase